MKPYTLLKIVSKILFPFLIVFGIYIIMNGHMSPGGGFQGGVVLATSYILVYFIHEKNFLDINKIVKIEKILFSVLIFSAILFYFDIFKFGLIFENYKVVALVYLNFLIGIKVALGIGAIIGIFIEEGESR
jgi:multicomponent Na+:H+ antiporter subunit B